MSQKLPINSFKGVKQLSKFDEDFINNYDEESNKGYVLEVDVEYSNNLFNLHSDLSFLPERKKIEKCKKLFSSIHDNTHKSLKTSIKSGINTKKSIQSNSI